MAVPLAAFTIAALAGSSKEASVGADNKDLALATFAGGYFWCTESDF